MSLVFYLGCSAQIQQNNLILFWGMRESECDYLLTWNMKHMKTLCLATRFASCHWKRDASLIMPMPPSALKAKGDDEDERQI
jgi:hypothetical protein